MAQSGYTPISLYYSTTAAATPSSSNLTNGELAINITDGILYYKNSSGTVVPLTSSSGGITWQSVQSANFTATAGNAYPIDTTSAAITVTLPASPTSGQLIGLLDYAGTFATNNVVVNPNGNNLNGATTSVKLDQNNEGITFVYSGATQGWVSYSSYKAITPPSAFSVNYLIVAGGGSGGSVQGGGGAGGLLSGSGLSVDKTSTYTVTVGAGGASTSSSTGGNNGTNSSFSAYGTAAVGGGGGAGGGPTGPYSGGSGGGGGYGTGQSTGASGTSGQGNKGGDGPTGGGGANLYACGGGGGSSAVGGNFSGTTAGNGGAGTVSSISGSSVTYAGGGGGGVNPGGTAGLGGAGGGGNGGINTSSLATAGSANTGGGGGGGGYPSGAGGSGTVIVSYADTVQQMAGGSVTSSGGNIIHTFNSSGYLTPLTYVGNSVRLRGSASAYLNRTNSTAGNTSTWTWSAWVKRGSLGSGTYPLFTSYIDTANYSVIDFSNDIIRVINNTTTSGEQGINTTAVFRDPAAWYHIVASSTASSVPKLYINGVQVTAFSSSTSVTGAWKFASTNPIWLGREQYGASNNYFDGEMANVQFIDGQALTPNSFGSFNLYGVWQPISYGGTYGTNGFYLPFSNTTSTTTLGYDTSGNSNNWTCNNISLTAGSTYDAMTDSPTLTSTTAANYPTWNPLATTYYGVPTFSNGNLTTSATSSGGVSATTMYYPLTGKFYSEFTVTSGGSMTIGLMNSSRSKTIEYVNNGNITAGGSTVVTGASYTTGDVLGMAVSCDGQTVTFYKNNASQGTANFSSAPLVLGDIVAQAYCSGTSTIWNANFGQQPFAYTAPSGFLALNTYNM